MCRKRSLGNSIAGLKLLTEGACSTCFVPEDGDWQEPSSVLEPQRPGGLVEELRLAQEHDGHLHIAADTFRRIQLSQLCR